MDELSAVTLKRLLRFLTVTRVVAFVRDVQLPSDPNTVAYRMSKTESVDISRLSTYILLLHSLEPTQCGNRRIFEIGIHIRDAQRTNNGVLK